MKTRKLGIALLLMLAVVVTTGTFAYWTSGLAADDAATTADVTIGTGDTTASIVGLTAITVGGSALTPGDTATFTLTVEWNEDTTSDFTGVTGDLAVTALYSMTGNAYASTLLDDMFSISTDVATIVEGAAAATVIVTVTFFAEPTSSTIYDDVIGETLTVDLTFTVTPQ